MDENENKNRINSLLLEKKFDDAFKIVDELSGSQEKESSRYIIELLEKTGADFLNDCDYESAVKIFTKEISLDPYNGYYNRGLTYLDQEYFNKAANDLKSALNYKKTSDAYYYLGLAYLGDEKYDMAIDVLNKSCEIKKNFENTHYLGVAYLGIEEYDKAIKFLNTALAIRETPETYHYLGMAHLGSENYDEAIRLFTKAIERDREFADAYYYRGLAYHAIGSEKLSADDYKEAVKLNSAFLETPYESL